MTHTLNIDTLAHLDGGAIHEAFERRVRSAIADIMDRPADDRARRVVLTLSLSPDTDPDTGECRSVDVRGKVDLRIPPADSAKVRMQPRRTRGRDVELVFDEEDAEASTADAGQ